MKTIKVEISIECEENYCDACTQLTINYGSKEPKYWCSVFEKELKFGEQTLLRLTQCKEAEIKE